MKHARLVALIPLSLGASALAQPPLQQPAIPHDGAGVDYSQPYLNDLLLRSVPWVVGDSIANADDLPDCRKELHALTGNPLDPALDQAYDSCIEKRARARESLRRQHKPSYDGPAIRPHPFDPSESTFNLNPVPPVAPHPNAQN